MSDSVSRDAEATEETQQLLLQFESFSLPGSSSSEDGTASCAQTPTDGKRSKKGMREATDADVSSSKGKPKKPRRADEIISLPQAAPNADKTSSRTQTPTADKRSKKGKREATDADVSSSKGKPKKLRQADEKICSDGHVLVDVLCSQCRRDQQSKRQLSLLETLKACRTPPKVSEGSCPEVIDLVADSVQPDPTLCSRCRRSLVVEHLSVGKKTAAGRTSCAFSARLKQYKRGAVDTCAEWHLTDSEALAIMRDSCSLCGARADPEAGRPNGITRLRTDENVRGMGPYAIGNVATACSTCNMMKGIHTVQGMVEMCCSIATHRGLGDFGRFPERFRNNISRPSRSRYLGGDTQHKNKIGTRASKTHSLSIADFNRIVAMPCHYCGKLSDPPRHYNGLDRLDNSLRVYTETNSVSCCGTCNMAKNRMVENAFLEQCRTVAEFSRDRSRRAHTNPSDVVPDDLHLASICIRENEESVGSSKDDVVDEADEAHANECEVWGSSLEAISELGFGEAL